MSVDTPSFKVTETAARRLGLMCKDVYDGGDKVHKYMIKSVSESATEYSKRVELSSIKTTFKKGIDGFTDLLFKNPVHLTEDVPEKLDTYYKKLNGNQTLNEMAKGAFKETLLTNVIYWLVWTPENTAANAKEEEELGIRPYVEEIPLERIIDVQKDEMGNIQMIIVAGSYNYESGRYGVETKPEYRIYFADGEVEIWRENAKGEVNLYDTVQLEVPEMPIVELEYEEQTENPAFVNEANIQLQQYNIDNARFSYNLKLAYPIVKTWGLLQNSRNIARDSIDEEGNPVKVVEFQSSKGIDFPVNPETGAKLGDIGLTEVSGGADAVLKSTSDDMDQAIADGFIQLVTSESGNKTVAEAENERARGEGTLSSASQNLQNFLNDVHRLMCLYAGEQIAGEVIVNTEFASDDLDQLEYNMLTDLYAEQIIDKRQLIEELQKYGKLKTVEIDALMDRLTAVGMQ